MASWQTWLRSTVASSPRTRLTPSCASRPSSSPTTFRCSSSPWRRTLWRGGPSCARSSSTRARPTRCRRRLSWASSRRLSPTRPPPTAEATSRTTTRPFSWRCSSSAASPGPAGWAASTASPPPRRLSKASATSRALDCGRRNASAWPGCRRTFLQSSSQALGTATWWQCKDAASVSRAQTRGLLGLCGPRRCVYGRRGSLLLVCGV
mmetsp:Transcript_1607/g.4831  ORF Transcript_1607/g.4831 Transcript_1607/m.4831 type:complete len:207 (-) Transcript_1607:29-649(-)